MRMGELSEIPRKSVKQKRGEGKAGSRGCIVPPLFLKKWGTDLTKNSKKEGDGKITEG